MFPKFMMIKQKNEASKIDDVKQSVLDTINNCGDFSFFKDKTIGIAVGSRGISNIELIVKTVVDYVKEMGATPVIFPAMGSHGGGTAEGQKEILLSLGIEEETMGCEIRTCAESEYFGTTESGIEVFGNKVSLQFDNIILINRIKPHTDFEDITESGIFKLMAIGIGNPRGAASIHANAVNMGYGPVIREAGHLILKKLPVAFALAITENWKHETDYLEAILPENLLEAEMRILAKVKENSVKLPVKYIDTLLVAEAGKNISGTCVDTKVIGRIMVAGQKEPESPKIKTIAVFDFTDESHGNSMGLGVVDVVSRRVFDKIDIIATGLTGMTSTCLLQAKIPCVAPSDYLAVNTAITSSGVKDVENMKAIFIKNTNALETIAVTESVYNEIKDNPNIEKLSDLFELEFDAEGNLLTDVF